MDFDSLPQDYKDMLRTAYKTIERLNKKEFLKTYVPPSNKGFMWDENTTIIDIMNNINNDYDCHSTTSLAYTMRYLQYIIKNDINIM